MYMLSDPIDKMATRLESLGCFREAYELDVIANTVEAAINTQALKQHPRFQESKRKIRDIWNKKNMEVLFNPNVRDKIQALLVHLELQKPGYVDDKVIETVHDIASAGKTEVLLKLDNKITPEEFDEIVQKYLSRAAGIGDLSKGQQEIFNRVKVIEDFGDGWQWVMAVDEQGNPRGFMPNEISQKTMNHCGNAPTTETGDVYYELRKNNKPYLSVVVDRSNNIKEAKGYGNHIPKNKKEIAPYMKWFMMQPNIKGVSYDKGYARDQNFGIMNFLGIDDEFVNYVEKNKPGLIHEEVDRKIIDYKKKLNSGEINKEDIIKAFENEKLMLEHVRGILGEIPFDEGQLLKYVKSGRLGTIELGNASTRALTPKIQEALLEHDMNAPEALMNIHRQVPNSGVNVDPIIRKKPWAIRYFPEDQKKEIYYAHVDAFNEAFRKDPWATLYFPEDQRKEIHDAHVDAFDEVFKKNPSSILSFPKDQRKEIHDAHVDAFDEVFRKDPGVIKYFPEDQRKKIHDAHVDAFDEAFRKKPWVTSSFPEDQRKEIYDKHVDAFDEGFRKYPWAIENLPKDQWKEIHDAHVDAFNKWFREKPGVISYFPEDRRKEIYDKHVDAFDEGFKENPLAIKYFPRDQRKKIHDAHVDAFDEGFRKKPKAIESFPYDQRKEIHDKHVDAFDEGFRVFPSAIETFPEDQVKEIYNKHVDVFDEVFRKDPSVIKYFPKDQRKEIYDAQVDAFDEGFRKNPKAIKYFSENQIKKIYDAHVDAFNKGFWKKPKAIEYFPADQRKDIKKRHPSVWPQEKQEKAASGFLGLTDLLDKTANHLEGIGCFREAYELDVINNTLDRLVSK